MTLKNNIFFAVTMVLLLTSGKPVGRKTLSVHNKVITIDTHCDTPMKFVNKGFDIGKEHEAPDSRIDLPRMKSGGLDAIFFAIFQSTSSHQRKLHTGIQSSQSDD